MFAYVIGVVLGLILLYALYISELIIDVEKDTKNKEFDDES